jgi:glyoxylase I family protein
MAIEVRGLAPLLQVYDMATSVRFYRDQLGFTVTGTDGRPAESCDWCMLQLGDSMVMLNTRYEAHDRPPAPDPVRTGHHDDASIYFGCPDVNAAYAELRARGVAATEPHVTHYGFRTMSVKDPDGFSLVFHWPVEP